MAVKKAKAATREPKRELEITLVRSLIGCSPAQRAVASGLGLRKLNSRAIRQDNPEIRGMVSKISHLVKVEAREIK
jgi:large subunit ribosomal protein L30